MTKTFGLTLEQKFEAVKDISPAWDRVAHFSWNDLVGMRDKITDLESRLSALQQSHGRLLEALRMFYDKWENGIACSEADEEGNIETGTSIGNAVKLSFTEEQTILNLIVDKPEPHEEACANCGKPYRAHLLHDHNKCSPERDAAWFPDSIPRSYSRGHTTYERGKTQ